MENKVAVVTGAGSGIGRATAVALASAGFKVVLAGRREEMLYETAALLQGDSLTVVTDVSSAKSVEQLFGAVRERFGRVDLLFNNAGAFGPTCLFEEVTFQQWSDTVAVNLNGSFLCAQAAFRIMKDQSPQGGRIINNGSISAHAPRPNAAAYTATKHAITGLTKALSLDGRKYGIVCGQIDIGNASTELSAAIGKGALQADGSIMAEPQMDVKHVGEAIVYMANLPLSANVQFMTVLASKMPFIGRG